MEPVPCFVYSSWLSGTVATSSWRMASKSPAFTFSARNKRSILSMRKKDQPDDDTEPVGPGTASSKAKPNDLEVWASKFKIEISDSLQLSNTDLLSASKKKELGVFAKTDIKLDPSKPLVRVPAELTFTVNSLDNSNPLRKFVRSEFYNTAPWWLKLATQLLFEKYGGYPTDLKTYLSNLPQSFNTPFHWKSEVLEYLQYPPLAVSVNAQREQYKLFYKQFLEHLVKNPKDDSNSTSHMIRYDEFVWAIEVVRSRAFSGECEPATFKQRLQLVLFVLFISLGFVVLGLGEPQDALNGGGAAISSVLAFDLIYPRVMRSSNGPDALKRYVLCPIIDLFNHTSRASSDVSYEYFYDKFAVCISTNPRVDKVDQTRVPAGAELFISYGPQSNDHLLQYFGFVEEHNMHDVYVLSESFADFVEKHEAVLWSSSTGSDKVALSLASCLEQLKELNLDAFGRVAARRPLDPLLSEEEKVKRKEMTSPSLDYVLDSSSRLALRVLLRLLQGDLLKSTDIRKYSVVDPALDKQALGLLHIIISLELAQLSTTLEQDLSTLSAATSSSSKSSSSSTMNQTKLLGLKFRIEKKRMLKQLAEYLEPWSIPSSPIEKASSAKAIATNRTTST